MLCMRKLSAFRDTIDRFDAHFTKLCDGGFITILESKEMVDGLGGVVWDGSFLLCHLLDNFKVTGSRILELGCGTGLCGILAALLGAEVLLSDRVVNLAVKNLKSVLSAYHITSAIPLELEWERWSEYSELFLDYGSIDLIIGAEICVLHKQQDLLTNVIDAVAGPQTVVLLTFDGPPPPHKDCGQYETAMLRRMGARGFVCQLALHGAVQWVKDLPPDLDIPSGYSDDLSEPLSDPVCRPTRTFAVLEVWGPEAAPMDLYQSWTSTNGSECEPMEIDMDCGSVFRPTPNQSSNYVPPDPYIKDSQITRIRSAFPPPISVCEPVERSESAARSDQHHVWAFFRRTAGNTCRRCNQHYLHVLNGGSTCAIHSGSFSVPLGEDAAVRPCWDCCGSSELGSAGCLAGPHEPY